MTKTIITYGTFDMFHIGHLNLLRRLSDMADNVVVAVSTDEFNAVKNKKVLIPFEQRAAIVEASQYVDCVIPEQSWEQKERDIREHNVDIFAIGEDWRGEFDFVGQWCEVVYLERTHDISTTALKQSLKRSLSISLADLEQALEVLHLLKRDLE